jgi:hypothetical protein
LFSLPDLQIESSKPADPPKLAEIGSAVGGISVAKRNSYESMLTELAAWKCC